MFMWTYMPIFISIYNAPLLNNSIAELWLFQDFGGYTASSKFVDTFFCSAKILDMSLGRL